MQIKLNHTALKAVSIFAGKKDIRYYLNGVAVEAVANETRLVGTNGHALGVHRMVAENDCKGLVLFIIPNDTVSMLLKLKKPKGWRGEEVTITVPDDCAAKPDSELRADCFGQSILFRRIDGKYPDYTRVIPTELSGEVAAFDPKYLMLLQKAVQCFHDKAIMPAFRMNGNGPALAVIHEAMIAVVMPMRGDVSPDVGAAHWARSGLVVPKLPEVTATCTAEVAAMIDPDGGLQRAGLVAVAA